MSENSPDPSSSVPPIPAAPPPPVAPPSGAQGAPANTSPPAPPYAAPPYPTPPAPAAYAPPAYPQRPGWYGTAPAYAQPKTSGLAVASLVCSLVGVVFSWTIVLALASVVGAILGHIALKRLATSGEAGRGMALTGVIVGWAGTALLLLFTFLFVVLPILLFVAAGTAYTTYS